MQGNIRKMRAELPSEAGAPVQYRLPIGDDELPINDYLGKPLQLEYTGKIHCTHCGRKTNKSFSQGFCFPCMKSLAQCDMCIMKPEQCHYEQGTCREPLWGEQHCLTPHYVYLANSSGVKVGITRETQVPTRWIDQGAIQALPILKVQTRYISGLVEVALAEHVADKTNWRKMLKGEVEPVDLMAKRDQLLARCEPTIAQIKDKMGGLAIQRLPDDGVVDIEFPVLEYPTKVTSLNFDKTPVVGGVLNGIKGQYLLFDTGVINIRKFTAYEIQVNV